MYRLNETLRNRLIAEAKKYDSDQNKLFQAELGWEDWMNDFTESEEGEPITDAEGAVIESILDEIFEVAHEEE